MRIDRTWDISQHRGLVSNVINNSEAKLELSRIVEVTIGDCIIETDGLNRPDNILVNLYTLSILMSINSIQTYTFFSSDHSGIGRIGYKLNGRYEIEKDELIPNNQVVLYDERNTMIVGVITILNY